MPMAKSDRFRPPLTASCLGPHAGHELAAVSATWALPPGAAVRALQRRGILTSGGRRWTRRRLLRWRREVRQARALGLSAPRTDETARLADLEPGRPAWVSLSAA